MRKDERTRGEPPSDHAAPPAAFESRRQATGTPNSTAGAGRESAIGTDSRPFSTTFRNTPERGQSSFQNTRRPGTCPPHAGSIPRWLSVDPPKRSHRRRQSRRSTKKTRTPTPAVPTPPVRTLILGINLISHPSLNGPSNEGKRSTYSFPCL